MIRAPESYPIPIQYQRLTPRHEKMAEPHTTEKRKFERYLGKEGGMVGIVSSDETHYTRLVKILDVSKGGLAFECTNAPIQESRAGFLDILGLEEKPAILIKTVPFRVVYNREVESHPAGDVRMNRCGVEFGKLSDSQLSQLDLFIQNYAVQ